MQKSRPAEFIALVAMMTAMVAMSIDTMLPGLGVMAKELGAAQDNDRQFILLIFFAGMMVGTPIWGPLSDSIARKPTIFMSLVIYALGAMICFLSSTFTMLLIGRFVQGIGAAGPRTVSMAMVRDGAKGADMARIISFVMSVFMLVPIFAPSIGLAVMHLSSWRMIFLGFVVAAVVVGLWLGLRQGETLPVERRQAFSVANLWASAKAVFANPICLGYTLAVGFVFGIFTAYLGVCQQLIGEQYGLGDKFAYWFGAFGIVIAISMVVNGKLVRKMGMRNLSRKAMLVYIGVWISLLVLCLSFDGLPPIYLLALLFVIWFFAAGFTFGNFNAMAMEPMGKIAGMASAISGTISQAMAIVLGGFAGQLYHGSLTPLAICFVAFAMCSFACAEWAESHREKTQHATA
jgi:DHA1 family bicyclomycin/chloramphenicol resistance-like MFS transporter